MIFSLVLPLGLFLFVSDGRVLQHVDGYVPLEQGIMIIKRFRFELWL